MEYHILAILFGVFLLLAVLIWLLLRFIKKKKKEAQFIKNSIPQEVLDMFNDAEEKSKQGYKDPYDLSWEIAKENSEYLKGGNNGTESIDTRTGTSNIQEHRVGERPDKFQPMDDGRDRQVEAWDKHDTRSNRKLGRI